MNVVAKYNVGGQLLTCHNLKDRMHSEASIIYVNYGRVEDFELLTSRGVNLANTVLLMRTGQISDETKVDNGRLLWD